MSMLLHQALLGVGISLLLNAGLGSDGYSTMINGLHKALGVPYVTVNIAVSLVLVGLAWSRGTRPGPGTLTQPLVVGTTVSTLTSWLSPASTPTEEIVQLVIAFVLMTVGVAGYLNAELGAGPVEAAAKSLDPPISFRLSYTMVQCGGALIGYMLGADVGIGTVIIVVLTGPAVSRLRATRRPTALRFADDDLDSAVER